MPPTMRSNTYLDLQKSNEERSDQFLNTTEDRDRLRARLRFGVQASLIPNELDAGFRLVTGSSSDPVSTNQTLGNTDRPYSVFLDRLFLAWRSHSNVWSAWGGRMPNPWFSTDLVWDEDLAFDGVALKVNPLRDLTESSPDFDPFLTLGVFPLQEVELSQKDKWLYGAQAGFNARLGGSSKMVFAVAYYDYRNIEGERNALDSNLLDHTAPQFVQKGNTLFRHRQHHEWDHSPLRSGIGLQRTECNGIARQLQLCADTHHFDAGLRQESGLRRAGNPATHRWIAAVSFRSQSGR
jgi:hypothetical protein